MAPEVDQGSLTHSLTNQVKCFRFGGQVACTADLMLHIYGKLALLTWTTTANAPLSGHSLSGRYSLSLVEQDILTPKFCYVSLVCPVCPGLEAVGHKINGSALTYTSRPTDRPESTFWARSPRVWCT